MNKTRVVGDIHGNFHYIQNLAEDPEIDRIIQVGDFGIGFGRDPKWLSSKISFLRGNHDDYSKCRNYSNFLPDGHVEELSDGGGSWMSVGGAWSIDWSYRTPGRDWWFDEEVHGMAFEKYLETYKEVKPKVMFTHDCPHTVALELFGSPRKLINPTTTSRWLDLFKDAHKPELWIFGHWHELADKVIDGTRYICLPEYGYIDLPL